MWRPCFIPFPHHHHHHHHNHGHHCHLFHRHVCPNFPNFPATNTEQLFSSTEFPKNDVVYVPEVSDPGQYPESTPPLLEEKESEEGIIEEEYEDDEPIFVLTDEWRDFFAKSEAKRKLEKKLAKKGKKEALKLSDESLRK